MSLRYAGCEGKEQDLWSLGCESRIAEHKGAGILERASVGQGRLRGLAFSEQAEAFRELGL